MKQLILTIMIKKKIYYLMKKINVENNKVQQKHKIAKPRKRKIDEMDIDKRNSKSEVEEIAILKDDKGERKIIKLYNLNKKTDNLKNIQKYKEEEFTDLEKKSKK